MSSHSDTPGSITRIVGLMSGTSLDGVDAACCRVWRERPTEEGEVLDPTAYELTVEGFCTVPYPRPVRERLAELCAEGTVEETCRLHTALAAMFADAARQAAEAAGLTMKEVDFVASHGQTIRHLPNPERVAGCDEPLRSTLQIGDADALAARVATPVIADFRPADIAVGGQGAPLMPVFDVALLADDAEFRAVQNLGGIGNCTLLPPNPELSEVRAFDTGPGNMVIDGVMTLLTDGEATYDEDGEMAAAGTVDEGLVTAFLDDEFFRAEPPKTTGREAFGAAYAERFLSAGRDRGLSPASVVASATALTGRSIADAYERFAPRVPDRVLVSGGGTNNPTLLGMLRAELSCPVDRVDDHGYGADAKEAALMALLGAFRVDGTPGNVPGATGADRRVVLGKRSGVIAPEPEY